DHPDPHCVRGQPQGLRCAADPRRARRRRCAGGPQADRPADAL
ncbi:MAG: hypothetical protein AVDCRST_MAG34-1384, partial [uncultured Nocardioidaceae bacterium]